EGGGGGGGAADQARRPEAGPPRRILPADVPPAGVAAPGPARGLEDAGPRESPVGREALELDLAPRAAPDRDGLPGHRRPTIAGVAAADLERVEPGAAPALLLGHGGH